MDTDSLLRIRYPHTSDVRMIKWFVLNGKVNSLPHNNKFAVIRSRVYVPTEINVIQQSVQNSTLLSLHVCHIPQLYQFFVNLVLAGRGDQLEVVWLQALQKWVLWPSEQHQVHSCIHAECQPARRSPCLGQALPNPAHIRQALNAKYSTISNTVLKPGNMSTMTSCWIWFCRQFVQTNNEVNMTQTPGHRWFHYGST